jgi:hypothetical protein
MYDGPKVTVNGYTFVETGGGNVIMYGPGIRSAGYAVGPANNLTPADFAKLIDNPNNGPEATAAITAFSNDPQLVGSISTGLKAASAPPSPNPDAPKVETTEQQAPTPQTEQQNKQYAASGGAQDDKSNPPQAGQTNNTSTSNTSPGLPTPAVATPTTQAASQAAPVELDPVTITGKRIDNKLPGKRLENPLSNFSSYTYKISLYMITPDAYEAFVSSGRKNLNAIYNISADGEKATAKANEQSARDLTTSNNAPSVLRGMGGGPPASPSSSAKPVKQGGAYLIAQSGGINNSFEKRAPGFDLDFYIDDLKITQAISGKDVQGPTNVTEFSFTITEPYGFSLLTKLRLAQNELAANTNSKNFALVQNPGRQMFLLGIRFLGYDKDGNVIDPSKIPGFDGNPEGNAFGLYERYYDILIRDLKFKITGKPTVYNILAKSAGEVVGFGSKFSTVWYDTPIVANNVYNALMGGAGAGLKPNENPNTAPATGEGAMVGLLSKLNYDQQQLVGKGGVTIPREYTVTFIGPDSDYIKDASLISNADIDFRKMPTSTATKTSESTIAIALANGNPDTTLRTIKIAQGTPIIQAISDIIKQSQYMEDALAAIDQTSLTPDEDKKSSVQQPNEPNEKPRRLNWFSITAEVTNLGWDPNQGDFSYKINYIIQEYLTPVVVAASASNLSPYYGPHKRYNYWYTGKNSEVISYEQNLDYAFYNVTLNGFGVNDVAQGGAADIPMSVGQPQGQPDQGRINEGMEAQNMYMNSLFSPKDFGNVKIKILGDPDFLMQPTPSSINSLYNRYYGTDGYTVNPNGGMVFIEINFKEPKDYNNQKGTMNINDSIKFFNYPDSIQKGIDSRGGGVSLMVKTVVSTFSKGKFEQDLNCSLNTFGDPGKKSTEDGSDNRFARQGTPTATGSADRSGTTGVAPTANDVGSAPGTGFSASAAGIPSASTFADPSQLGKAGLLGSVGSINNVLDPMQRMQQNQSITILTKSGPVADGEAGTPTTATSPTIFGRG